MRLFFRVSQWFYIGKSFVLNCLDDKGGLLCVVGGAFGVCVVFDVCFHGGPRKNTSKYSLLFIRVLAVLCGVLSEILS